MNPIGRALARYLDQPVSHAPPFAAIDPASLMAVMRPGDVLLVEGNTRISIAVKYLTQSTWSYAALYVGDTVSTQRPGTPAGALIEADLQRGVIVAPLAKYATFNTRICRPVGLTAEDISTVVHYMIGSLGRQYDLKNVFDLMRYLVRAPVPARWRRRALALGSGDPTRAICSTLIAEAFQSVHFPILPGITSGFTAGAVKGSVLIEEVMHIRHHSLFTPRDFDVSPYFRIVKPAIEGRFDYHEVRWASD